MKKNIEDSKKNNLNKKPKSKTDILIIFATILTSVISIVVLAILIKVIYF